MALYLLIVLKTMESNPRGVYFISGFWYHHVLVKKFFISHFKRDWPRCTFRILI